MIKYLLLSLNTRLKLITVLFVWLCSLQSFAQWTQLGSTGFANGPIGYPAMAIDSTGKPWVAYVDSSLGGRVVVKKLIDPFYITVGAATVSSSPSLYTNLLIDTGNNPIVSFASASGYISVMRFDSAQNIWTHIDSGINTRRVTESLCALIDQECNLYISFNDILNSNKPTVLKLHNAIWTTLYTGPENARNLSMAFNQSKDTLYLAFLDADSSYTLKVTNIMTGATIRSGTTLGAFNKSNPKIALSPDGSIYVAYYRSAPNNDGVVINHKNGVWNSLQRFTTDAATPLTLQVSHLGNPFVGYFNNSRQLIVKKYTSNIAATPDTVGHANINLGTGFNPVMLLPGDDIFIAYKNIGSPSGGTLKKFNCNSAETPLAIEDTLKICTGQLASLSISGNLNGANYWQWHQDSCNGVLRDTGVTIYVHPSITSTYYVNGIGTCPTPGNCSAVTVLVDSFITPSITITVDKDSNCIRQLSTFTAHAINPGISPVYQWLKNNQPVGNNSPQYIDSLLEDSDVISCTLTPQECAFPSTVLSNKLTNRIFPHLPLAINASRPLIFCFGDSLILKTTNTYDSYNWNTGSINDSIIVFQSGTYFLTVSQLNCYAVDSITVTASADSLAPVINSLQVPNLCPGGSITLSAENGYSGYLWNTGSTAQNIVVDSAGIYSVIVSESNCTGRATITVNVGNYTLAVNIQTSNPHPCVGDSIVINASPGLEHYNWNTGDTTSSIVVTNSEIINLTVSNLGCIGSNGVNVIFYQPIAPVINPVDGGHTICNGVNIHLDAGSDYDSYLWNTGDTREIIEVADSGDYNVTVTSNGCTTSATQSIHVNLQSRITVILDSIQDTLGYTIIYVKPENGNNYLWQQIDPNPSGSSPNIVSSFSTGDDSIYIFCYMLAVRHWNGPFWTPEPNWAAGGDLVRVIVSDGGCKDTSSLMLIENCQIFGGIIPENNIANLKLAPNPANESIELSLEAINHEQLSIVLTDITGKIVSGATQKILEPGENKMFIPVQFLQPGLYLVTVNSPTQTQTTKFIKQ